MQAESKYQDIHLLALQVKEGNQKAFNILFDKLWEPLYRHTQSIIMDEPASKDIIQEIWIDYWNRRALIQTDNIRAHLFKAAKYKAFNYLRDHKFVPVNWKFSNFYLRKNLPLKKNRAVLPYYIMH